MPPVLMPWIRRQVQSAPSKGEALFRSMSASSSFVILGLHGDFNTFDITDPMGEFKNTFDERLLFPLPDLLLAALLIAPPVFREIRNRQGGVVLR